MRGTEHGLRYARVPTGEETCGWCLMLASRDFAFTGASAAAAGSHEGCDCIVVPGTAATRVEGYDPEGMATRWGECVSCVDGEWLTRRARAEWEALAEGERAVWRGKVDAATAELLSALGEERLDALGLGSAASGEEQAFSRYRSRRLLAEALREVERRDPAWAYRGEVPAVDYSAEPRSFYGRLLAPGDYSPENIVDRGEEWRDIYVHDVLSKNGFAVATRRADAPKGYSNIDLTINGELWEVKSPRESDRPLKEGRELSFVEDALRAAKKQFHNQHDPETGAALDYTGPVRVVLNTYYRPADKTAVSKKILYEMGRHNVDEVMHVNEEGVVARIKK